ncbi:GNAT family N-acetyltransferase [Spiroplasma turonicum]|uniref:Acetyltransferase, GNAT family protein n=1 Tax=Spiroplasma turonicum TaxID=216946 RepID=A0A0K1P655_9MOLU|nr:GNAT family N-acetyltransferase [Spiroplasma turonicum]AKU79781.1 acetyltransferase, GNAT family protein [Spiroplasma turonicum]ALX70799.1 acetyltransferase, GNAT family protein [Spiroplasma turonicum]
MEGINFRAVFNVDNKLFFDALLVRKKVFVDEQNVDITEEIDDFDDKAYHVVGYLLNEAVCCARIYSNDNKWYWGRIAVLGKYRGKKIGNKLMDFLKDFSKKELSLHEVYIHAQNYAVNFYEKNGFKKISDVYMDTNIEHVDMKLLIENED